MNAPSTLRTNGKNYVLVTKGVRIHPDNLTVDIDPETAKKLRDMMITAHRNLENYDNEHMAILRRFCDGLAGPLGVHPPQGEVDGHC